MLEVVDRVRENPDQLAKRIVQGFNDAYRVRKGDCRIIITFTDEEVMIRAIGHRRDVYEIHRRMYQLIYFPAVITIVFRNGHASALIEVSRARNRVTTKFGPAANLPNSHIFLVDCMPVPPFPEKHPASRWSAYGSTGEVACTAFPRFFLDLHGFPCYVTVIERHTQTYIRRTDS